MFDFDGSAYIFLFYGRKKKQGKNERLLNVVDSLHFFIDIAGMFRRTFCSVWVITKQNANFFYFESEGTLNLCCSITTCLFNRFCPLSISAYISLRKLPTHLLNFPTMKYFPHLSTLKDMHSMYILDRIWEVSFCSLQPFWKYTNDWWRVWKKTTIYAPWASTQFRK